MKIYATCLKNILKSIGREYAKLIITVISEDLLKGMNNNSKLEIRNACVDILTELSRLVAFAMQQIMSIKKQTFSEAILSCLDSDDKKLKKSGAVCLGEFGPILPKSALEKTVNQLLDRSKNKDNLIVEYAVLAMYLLAMQTGEQIGNHVKNIIPFYLI